MVAPARLEICVELLKGENDRDGPLVILLQPQDPRTPVRPIFAKQLTRGVELAAAQTARVPLFQGIEGEPTRQAADRTEQVAAHAK